MVNLGQSRVQDKPMGTTHESRRARKTITCRAKLPKIPENHIGKPPVREIHVDFAYRLGRFIQHPNVFNDLRDETLYDT